jgi:hypothetical protein
MYAVLVVMAVIVAIVLFALWAIVTAADSLNKEP